MHEVSLLQRYNLQSPYSQHAGEVAVERRRLSLKKPKKPKPPSKAKKRGATDETDVSADCNGDGDGDGDGPDEDPEAELDTAFEQRDEPEEEVVPGPTNTFCPPTFNHTLRPNDELSRGSRSPGAQHSSNEHEHKESPAHHTTAAEALVIAEAITKVESHVAKIHNKKKGAATIKKKPSRRWHCVWRYVACGLWRCVAMPGVAWRARTIARRSHANRHANMLIQTHTNTYTHQFKAESQGWYEVRQANCGRGAT